MRRRRRRRARRNPLDSHTAKQIGWTIAITAVTAATSALVIWWVNKKLEPKLPPTTEKPENTYDATKKTLIDTTVPPPPPPKPASIAQLSLALPSVSTVITPQVPACPAGYHAVPTGQPNFPWMCIQDGY